MDEYVLMYFSRSRSELLESMHIQIGIRMHGTNSFVFGFA